MKKSNHYPRLVADIGGTNARFGIEVSHLQYENIQVYDCTLYPTMANAINVYLEAHNMRGKIHYAVIAIPSPIVSDTMFMVNSPWHDQSMSKTKEDTKLEHIIFLNDFHALVLAIPFIKQEYLVQVGGTDAPNPQKPIALIGPGTGLGMATLFKHPLNDDYFALPAEGGRSSFAPANEEELELWKYAHRRYSHVSVERFVCGPGLQFIYEGLCHIDRKIIDVIPTPAQITDAAIAGSDIYCKRTLQVFYKMLGTIASNLTVTTNAFGGVYIGGGIIPRILEDFIKSDFRGRFEAKGRFHSHLAKIPVYVITDPFPAFLGASYALDTYLNKGYIP